MARQLMKLGVSVEAISICGMILGLVAGLALSRTATMPDGILWWIIALLGCSARLILTVIGEAIADTWSTTDNIEEESYRQLPERVSDAVTMIGLGFAELSNPWLGLATALLAILSSYSRALREPFDYRGFMNRKHRLAIVICTSFIMLFTTDLTIGGISIPTISLALISIGCASAIIYRWIAPKSKMANRKNSKNR